MDKKNNNSLSKFLAQAGVCARRKATELIKAGLVSVNNRVVTEPGYKVHESDIVRYKNNVVAHIQKIYILLNKPKGYITTVEDEKGRRTVMDLIEISERIYPVGRLDRNTTGLLLLTNDGELAQKLAHPRYNISKTYHVTLDKNITQRDVDTIAQGIMLEDGLVQVDTMYIYDKKNIEITLHSGKNRIIRRLFEALGYDIEKLDRISYANLNKKGLSLGKWRYLTKAEIAQLYKLL